MGARLASTLLGPAPTSAPSTAHSGPFELLLTVAHTDGLGLDTAPARGCVETGRSAPLRWGPDLSPRNTFPTTDSLPFLPPFQRVANCPCTPIYPELTSRDSHLAWGQELARISHSEHMAPGKILTQEHPGTLGSSSLFLTCLSLYPSPRYSVPLEKKEMPEGYPVLLAQ